MLKKGMCVAIDMSQPFRLLAEARRIVCTVLTIAVVANFYMLPNRELASP